MSFKNELVQKGYDISTFSAQQTTAFKEIKVCEQNLRYSLMDEDDSHSDEIQSTLDSLKSNFYSTYPSPTIDVTTTNHSEKSESILGVVFFGIFTVAIGALFIMSGSNPPKNK